MPVVNNRVGGKILSFESHFCSHTQHIANYRDNSEKTQDLLDRDANLKIFASTHRKILRFGLQFKNLNLTFSLIKCVNGPNVNITLYPWNVCAIDYWIVRVYCFKKHKVNVVSWEPEGRYCSSKMFHWEPEEHYFCTKSIAIAPFWVSMEHLWSAIAPFWLSADDVLFSF